VLAELPALVPVLMTTLAAVAVLVAEAFRAADERLPFAGLCYIGLGGAFAAAGLLWNRDLVSFGVVRADNFALFITLVVAVVGILTVALSGRVAEQDGWPPGEYYSLVLFAAAGMMLMAAAVDLLVMFLALEILSLSVYVLTGLRRTELASTEGAFKYFLLGAVSSAFFLYGMAFAFAVGLTTRLDGLGEVLAARAMEANPLALAAVALLLVGFGFKISAVPFHMWTPDAYQGAPAVVTGFMSTGVKAAAFAALVRVLLSTFEPARADWAPVVAALAVATMVLGTVVGVVQTSLKRMLAYSSIAHGGYVLIGVVAGSAVGKAAVLFYLAAYAVTNLGAFGVVALVASRGREHDQLDDYRGLWWRHPVLAAALTIFLLSLGGFPPTAGFVAKWYIFSAAVQEGYYGLAIVGVLTSVVAVFFYLRVVVMMYMNDAPAVPPPVLSSRSAVAALTLAAVAVFYLGVLPARVLDLAAQSVATIF
jgi:NADH-quinone oxidoreductase subunit N